MAVLDIPEDSFSILHGPIKVVFTVALTCRLDNSKIWRSPVLPLRPFAVVSLYTSFLRDGVRNRTSLESAPDVS
jgi:hypothetical protein